MTALAHTLTAGSLFALLAPLPAASAAPGDITKGPEPQACTQVRFADQYGPAEALWGSPASAPRLRVPKIVLGQGDTLLQVEVTVSGSVGGSLGYENTAASPCEAFPQWSLSLGVQPVDPALGVAAFPFETSQLVTQSLPAFDGAIDYAGDSGATLTVPPSAPLQVTTLTADLAVFVDSAPDDGETEFVEFEHFALGDGSIGTSCTADVAWAAEATLSVELVYTVCSEAPPCPTETVLEPEAIERPLDVAKGEAQVLYSVRDELLPRTTAGRELTRAFYAHAAELHLLFLNLPELRRTTAALLRSLMPKLEDAAAGRSVALSDAERRRVLNTVQQLEPHASPSLRATLESLRRDLADGKFGDRLGLGG